MAPRPKARPLRLAVQDVALSRRKHGFESRRGHQDRRIAQPAASPATATGASVVGGHPLALFAELVDAEPHNIAGLEKEWRLLAHAHAGRRARGNYIAGMKAHELADVADEERGLVDHRRG